jgi:hypothetical protein
LYSTSKNTVVLPVAVRVIVGFDVPSLIHVPFAVATEPVANV